jgi:TRAP-type mannitol/chloroaromatic compound transport system permease small subunit
MDEERVLKLTERLGRVIVLLGKIGGWAVVPMMLAVVLDVIIRKVPFLAFLVIDNRWLHDLISSSKMQEWQWHFHTVLFTMAFGLTYMADRHVRIDGWREGRSNRGKALIEILGICLFLLPYACLMLFQAVWFVQMSYVSGEVSAATTGLGHRWIIKSFLIVSYVILIAAALCMLARAIVFFRNPPQGRRLPLGIVHFNE